MANYSCQARNTKLSEPPSSSIMIDMNLRPLKVRIENERIPVLADKALEVSCRADGSRPPAQISWWRNQVRLLPGDPSLRSHQRPQQQQQQQQVVSSDHHQEMQQQTTLVDLQIQDQHTEANLEQSSSVLTFVPQLDDAGQTITCKAENTRLPESSQYSIEDSWKLDVHYLPRVRLALGEKLADAPVREGHDVYFECTVRATPTAHEVRWWFAGRELESNQAAGVIISNQSLVLQHVSRKQRGRYTCSAINSVGESHSNGVHLRVQFAPFCRDATASDGNSDEATRSQSISSNALPLPNAEGQQLGTQFSAISQQRHKTHYGAARLEPVKVYCHVDADPVDQLTYKWAFVATTTTTNDSQQVQQVSSAHQQQQQQRKPEFSGQQLVYLDSSLVSSLAPENPLVGVASYTPRSELDYGTLLCWASNALGEQSEPCAYQIIPAERPDPVRNCRLLNASQVQLAVACEPGYDGGVEQSFQMEVYDSKRHELVANVTASSPAAVRSAAWWLTRDSPDDDTPTSGAGGEASGLGSRLQKQRHSSSATAIAGFAAASTALASDAPEQVSSTSNGVQHPPQQYEAVLLTETNLEPNTDYLLSIYSTNSKGVSKRVAFTATTANLTTTAERPVQIRDGRRLSDPSHLLGDVLSLSWHPFLLVCAVTLGLFIMFASITFAMMKYIDFSSGFNDGSSSSNNNNNNNNNNNCNGSSRDKKNSLAKQVVSPMRDKTIVALRSSNDSNSLRSDSPRSDLQSEQRARVISLASSAGNNHQLNNSTTLSDKAHCDLPLNAAVKDKGSLLNGGYLRATLHRLIGQTQQQQQQQVQCQTQKLKQSTSETYLNQLASVKSAVYLDRNQQQSSFCGTLPRNHLSGNLRFQPSSSNQHQQQQFIQLESSLNEQLYANKSLSSATNSETTNYSVNTSLDSHHQQQQQQQSAAAQVANAAILPAGNYLTPLGEQRVEQLVISGKQYIHQTSVGAGRLASVYLRQQQQQQQQQQSQVAQQRHHLQMTSAPYGSLQRANLYAATAMKDYHSQQQQTPLVFINQSAMMSPDQQQQMGASSRTDFAALPVEECALFMNGDGSVATSAPTQTGNCVSSFTNATKTSDLGSDDSQPMFATTTTTTAAAGLPGNTCHLAHLTLVDGATELRNALAIVDSDGLSSGTQRSIGTTSNGSPSSGVAELDHNYLYLQQQQQQVNSNSTTTANNQCCELVEHRLLNGSELGSTDSTAVINLTSNRARRHQQQQQQQTGKLSGKTGIQQLPNSRNIVVHHHQQQHQHQQPEAQQQLDSYTVFVDAHEFDLSNGNIGLESHSSKLTNSFAPAQTRVRLIGTSDLQQQQQQQQQQLSNGSTTTLTNDFCQNSGELQLQTEV